MPWIIFLTLFVAAWWLGSEIELVSPSPAIAPDDWSLVPAVPRQTWVAPVLTLAPMRTESPSVLVDAPVLDQRDFLGGIQAWRDEAVRYALAHPDERATAPGEWLAAREEAWRRGLIPAVVTDASSITAAPSVPTPETEILTHDEAIVYVQTYAQEQLGRPVTEAEWTWLGARATAGGYIGAPVTRAWLDAFLADATVAYPETFGVHTTTVLPLHSPSITAVFGTWDLHPVPIDARVLDHPDAFRTEGRRWFVDKRSVRPLGATLFWALAGWIQDRDRLRAHLAWLRAKGVTFIRILGDVDWAAIDSSAPGYESALADLIDVCWHEYDLRVEIAVWGGSARDPIVAATRVARVVMDRQEKIVLLEVANEAFKNGPAPDIQLRMLDRLRATGCLVAVSSPDPDQDVATYTEQAFAAGARVGTVHLDRAEGDEGWRMVRQPWGLRDLGRAMHHNEPIGPRSSVAQTTDPLRLACLRTVGIFAGVSGFVVHNGAGVTGVIDPAHDRPANLWEVPGIDTVMAMVASIDRMLPDDLENWSKTTQHGSTPVGDHPLTADAIWSDGVDHGVSRCYGANRGDGSFCTLAYGIKGYTDLTASHDLAGTIVDIATGDTIALALDQGRAIRIANADGTNKAVIITGGYR